MRIKKHLSFTSLRRQLSEHFKLIPDWRQSGKIKIGLHDVLMSGFAAMYFQDPSLLQFQMRMQEEQHRNNLRTLFEVENVPKETQMREIIDSVDSEYFRAIFKDYYLRLQRGKHLESYQVFPGLYYFPIDGSEFYSSQEIHCAQCLSKQHDETVTYSHQVLQGGIMHPTQSEVIPFMPEQICNSDGATKQDCEINAAKRFIEKLRQGHPQLGLILGGDGLFSKQPMIEAVLAQKMHYIFAAKPTDHHYLFEWISAYSALNEKQFIDDKGRLHIYEWMNDVPLNGREDAIRVNFFQCKIVGNNKRGKEEVLYRNSWVTDLSISSENISPLVQSGRCRWKNENECFNVMKNHGYYMDRNYGHGHRNLCFNFYLLTLLAFLFHQIFELTDEQYQACRKKLGSKKHLWEKLRSYIDILIFETWEQLLEFILTPKTGLVTWVNAP
jgi:hypothetical protein